MDQDEMEMDPSEDCRHNIPDEGEELGLRNVPAESSVAKTERYLRAIDESHPEESKIPTPVVVGDGSYQTVNIGSTRTSTSRPGVSTQQINYNFYGSAGPRTIPGQHSETRAALPGQDVAQALPPVSQPWMDPNYLQWLQTQQAAQLRYPAIQNQYVPNTAMVPQYHQGQQMQGYYPPPHAAQYGNQQYAMNQTQQYPQYAMQPPHQFQNLQGYAQASGGQMPTQQAQGVWMLPVTSTTGQAQSQHMETEGTQFLHAEYAGSSAERVMTSKPSRCSETTEPGILPEQTATEQQRKQELAEEPAQVYAGEHRMIGGSRPLAVKIVKYTPKTEREVKNLLKLTPHVNVVSIIDAREIPGRIPRSLFIAMEKCQTMNLEEYYEKRKKDKMPFNVKQALEFARQIVEGINHIHKNNIIHRDLKPSSVLFSLDGKNLKIIDFGVSKELEYGLSTMSISRGDIGTDGFRAPETYLGDEIKSLADIFSLGIVLYHIWSYGRHPFGEDSTFWGYNIKSGIDPDLSHLLVPNEEKAKGLLLCMLKKVHSERLRIAGIRRHEYIHQDISDIIRHDAKEVWHGKIEGVQAAGEYALFKRSEVPLRIEPQAKWQVQIIRAISMKSILWRISDAPSGYLAVGTSQHRALMKELDQTPHKMVWINIFSPDNERCQAIIIIRPSDDVQKWASLIENQLNDENALSACRRTRYEPITADVIDVSNDSGQGSPMASTGTSDSLAFLDSPKDSGYNYSESGEQDFLAEYIPWWIMDISK